MTQCLLKHLFNIISYDLEKYIQCVSEFNYKLLCDIFKHLRLRKQMEQRFDLIVKYIR